MKKNESLKKLRSELSPEKLALLKKIKGGKTAVKVSVIPKRTIDGPVPLSFSQQRLWFLDQLVPNTPVYNVVMAFRSSGELHMEILEKSINEIINRHEVLRTTFKNIEGEAFQIIAPTLTINVPEIDLRDYSESDREDKFQLLAHDEAVHVFDLSTGPLVRFSLFRMTDDEHIFLLNMHHIITDSWSLGVFFNEFIAIYTAYLAGKPSPLPELPIQYADFAVWQREHLQGEKLDAQLNYWKETLGDERNAAQLPADHPRPPIQNFHGKSLKFSFTPELSLAIKKLSKQYDSTQFMVVMTALKILLHKYTGQNDVCIGTPIANRTKTEIENLIGFFINTLVLKTDLSGDPTFAILLDRVREVSNGAYKHQDLPFELLVDKLQTDRDMSQNPLFQVCLVFQNVPLVSSETNVTYEKIGNDTSKFDLWISLVENDDVLDGEVEYNSDIFEEKTIQRILKSYEIILTGITDAPEKPISELLVMPDEEINKILREWNDTAVEYADKDKCLHTFIEEQAVSQPDKTALIFEGESITYQELDKRANKLANYLSDMGVGPETMVGVCMERSFEMVVALVGIIKAGGAYVPIDPTYPAERLTFMMADAEPPILLTQSHLIEILPEHNAKVVYLDPGMESIKDARDAPVASGVTNTTQAYMIYTSGSTGKPKGSLIEHKAIVNRLLWMQSEYQLTGEDRILQKTPFSFDVSVWEFFWPLMTGATMVIAKPEGHKDAHYLATLIQQENVTVMHFVPSMLQAFLEEPEAGNCKSLKNVICSGEALHYSTQERFFERLNARLHNLYGPTEAAVDVTYWECQKDSEKHIVPIGKPVANTQIYILDANLNPVPVGVSGELHIGGIQLARGYYKRDELTNEKFIPDPFSDKEGARLYKTGDLVRHLSDGNIEFIGRIDFQVKLRGFRIELGEIETALDEHDAIRKSVVLVREFENMPDNKQLVAYLIADSDLEKHAASQSGDELPDVQVSEWEQVFDKAYDAENTNEDDFNIVSWNSSYTGDPIPAEEMRVWVDSTIERILELNPDKALELGCGTGLLLAKVAPKCSVFWGTDLSHIALDYVTNKLILAKKELSHVKLDKRGADDITGMTDKGFDTIIVNSVVQYFPDVKYLVTVIKNAIEVLGGKGKIFLGDIRNFALLETFLTDVEYEKADASLTTNQLKYRVKKRMTQEQELVIDPEFFHALQHEIPEITNIDIQLKRGDHINELNRFRYDVTLVIGQEDALSTAEAWLDWKSGDYTTDGIKAMVKDDKPELIAITNIPNARIEPLNRKMSLLTSSNCPETVGEARQRLNDEMSGITPEIWWKLGEELGYTIKIGWVSGQSNGRYEVLCIRNDVLDKNPIDTFVTHSYKAKKAYDPIEHYANNPLLDRLGNQIIPGLRNYLRDRLPDYMVPNTFMFIKEIPVDSNGKLNRHALPLPAYDYEEMSKDYLAPRNNTEQVLADVWAEVLGLEKVGIKNNFFELGGDSIKSILVVSRVKQRGVEMTPQHIFQHSTIALLAEALQRESEAGTSAISECSQEKFALAGLTDDELTMLQETYPDMEDCYPVSAMQDSMLYHQFTSDETGLYVVHHAFQINGERLDIETFDKAWQYVINHFPALRTSFAWKGLKKPVQILHESATINIELKDWRDASPEEQRVKLNDYIQTFRQNGYDLEKAPQSQVAIIQISEDSAFFVYFFNLMLQDGWSYPIVIQSLFAAYKALSEGKEPKLTPAHPYRKFIEIQQQRDDVKAKDFWQKNLDGIDFPSPVLVDRTRKPEPVQPYIEKMAAMSPDLTKAVVELVKQCHITTYTLLQGAWALVLHKMSQQEDLVFGSVYSGRSNALKEIEEGVGLFFNILPIRLRIDPDMSLKTWLKEIQKRSVETSLYEHTSVQDIYDWCDIPKENLLFESYLISETLPNLLSIFEDLNSEMGAQPLDLMAQTEHALRVILFFTEEVLIININYYKRFYSKEQVAGMIKDMEKLLQGFVENPDKPLRDFFPLIAE